MNIKIIELAKDRVRILFPGEGHTFMNMLTEEILNNPGVDVAKYSMEFQFSDPELVVTTKGGKDPIAIIKEACKHLIKNCDELLDEIKNIE